MTKEPELPDNEIGRSQRYIDGPANMADITLIPEGELKKKEREKRAAKELETD